MDSLELLQHLHAADYTAMGTPPIVLYLALHHLPEWQC